MSMVSVYFNIFKGSFFVGGGRGWRALQTHLPSFKVCCQSCELTCNSLCSKPTCNVVFSVCFCMLVCLFVFLVTTDFEVYMPFATLAYFLCQQKTEKMKGKQNPKKACVAPTWGLNFIKSRWTQLLHTMYLLMDFLEGQWWALLIPSTDYKWK